MEARARYETGTDDPSRPAPPASVESVRIMRAESRRLGIRIYGGEHPSATDADKELAAHTHAQTVMRNLRRQRGQ